MVTLKSYWFCYGLHTSIKKTLLCIPFNVHLSANLLKHAILVYGEGGKSFHSNWLIYFSFWVMKKLHNCRRYVENKKVTNLILVFLRIE